MKKLLLGIIAINLTFISANLALRSVEPVQAEDSMSMSETIYVCSWSLFKEMHLAVKNERSNVKYSCKTGDQISIPAEYIKSYCDNSQPIYIEEWLLDHRRALYNCTYNGKKYEAIRSVCITHREECIDTETGKYVKVKRQS